MTNRLEVKMDQALNDLSELKQDVSVLKAHNRHTEQREANIQTWLDDHEIRLRGIEATTQVVAQMAKEISEIHDSLDVIQDHNQRITRLEEQDTSEELETVQAELKELRDRQTRFGGALTVVLGVLAILSDKILKVFGL